MSAISTIRDDRSASRQGPVPARYCVSSSASARASLDPTVSRLPSARTVIPHDVEAITSAASRASSASMEETLSRSSSIERNRSNGCSSEKSGTSAMPLLVSTPRGGPPVVRPKTTRPSSVAHEEPAAAPLLPAGHPPEQLTTSDRMLGPARGGAEDRVTDAAVEASAGGRPAGSVRRRDAGRPGTAAGTGDPRAPRGTGACTGCARGRQPLRPVRPLTEEAPSPSGCQAPLTPRYAQASCGVGQVEYQRRGRRRPRSGAAVTLPPVPGRPCPHARRPRDLGPSQRSAQTPVEAYRACEACGAGPRTHAQRHLARAGQSACVDVDIAELVDELWAAGCSTVFTCVDLHEEGYTQLGFSDSASLARAYETLAALIERVGGPGDAAPPRRDRAVLRGRP